MFASDASGSDDNKMTNDKRGRTPTFAILGAGFSGMGMAIRLRQEGIETFTIYEKADEVGGTWRENRYPGVACDVPSHLYSFSFAPNPNWSRRFSPGAEIFDYLKDCAEKYDLYRSIQFGKCVKSLRYNGQQWEITFADGALVKADYVISGLGGLHEPNIPDFAGANRFTGPMFHTAKWRDDVELAGKRVAIIGSAASAVQVIPEIVDKVARLDVYQRTPNWVMPRQSYSYPQWAKSLFAKVPLLARAYRGFYFSWLDFRFRAFHKDDNPMKRFVRRVFDKQLHAQVDDEALREKLTPNYPVGCKRILISDKYFPAIQKPNVDLVTDPIDEISPTGIVTSDGTARDVDVIILATGFKPFDILDAISVSGENGKSLKEKWKDGIAAYKTVAINGFPNFFLLLGPNSALGHNSVILMIEAQVNFITSLVKKAMATGATSVQPREDAAGAFDDTVQAALKNRVWAAECGSWYVDEKGRNYTLYPHNVRTFLKEMASPDLDAFMIASDSQSSGQ